MTIDSEDLWLIWLEGHLHLKIQGSDVAEAMKGTVVSVAEAPNAKGTWGSRLRVRYLQTEDGDGRWEARLASKEEPLGTTFPGATWSRCLPSAPTQRSNVQAKAPVDRAQKPKATKTSGQPKPRRVMGKESAYRRILASIAPDVFVDISTHPAAQSNGAEIYAGTRIPARIVGLMQRRENPGIRENWNETPVTLLRTEAGKGRNAHWYWMPSHPPLAGVWDIPIDNWKRAGAFEIIRDPFRWVDPRTMTPGVRKDPWGQPIEGASSRLLAIRRSKDD